MSPDDRHNDLEQRNNDLEAELADRDETEARLSLALAVQNRRMAEHQLLFRMLIESVKDYAIFLLDAEGRVVTWNAGAQRLKGFTAADIIGRHFSTFYPQADIDAGKCEMELEVAAREGRFEDEGWRVKKDGSQFWANVVISAVRDSKGELLGFSKVTRDLTERKRAEEERAARLAAEQANRAKDEFLAMLGHELRNPLAPIATALQLMKLRTGGHLSKEMQVIERQLGHMMRLVDDLLDVSRIVQGKIELKKQTVEIREVVAKALEIASPLIEQRQHRLDIVIAPEPNHVIGDEARLTQVLANLLVNAAKYTDPGGDIVVKVENADAQLVIEVCDTGIGIPPELLPHVFDLFVQGFQGRDRARGGLGIGLTLVRTLVALHGGTIEVRSAGPGKGSTFTMRLPAAVTSVERSKATTHRMRTAAEARRILLVDDNEDALQLLGEALEAAGHEVRTAADPMVALEIARTFRPELAILDIGLPTMDGYELGAKLRAELHDDNLRLIALTGYGQPSDRTRSTEAGFAAHFVKPVDVHRLSETIAHS